MSRFRTILRPLQAHPIWGAFAFSAVVLIVLWAVVPQVAQANALEDTLIKVVGFIIGMLVSLLGSILVKFIGILVAVAQFNNFIDAPAVKIGWSVTRDMANMFFIIALLLIAIGTMFRIDQYRYSRTLQKLIMMAILINFSKAIAGFFIDLSQVVMLTFVNAFKDQAVGSLSAGFGIDKLLALSKDVSAATGDINTLSVLGSLFAALIMVFVATVVVAIFTILLIQRIIMLWIYIVLAPTAYMVAVLPGSLGSWWGTWWRDFSQYLIKGPVIAFFLWLALTIITLSTDTLIPTTSTGSTEQSEQEQALEKPIFVSEATTGAAIINYLVAIGMLVAGLQQAAKSSGAAGAVAGKWMGNLNRWGGNMAMAPIRGARGIGGFAGRRAADLAKPTAYRVGEGALGLASKMNFLGIGAAARKQQASLRQQRLKAQDKDVSSAKFLDTKGERQILLGSAATLSGQGYQKAAMENAMRTHGLKGYSDEEKMQILSSYEKHIGYSKTEKVDANGKRSFVEGAIDSDGLKARKDLFKKSPGLLALRHDNATTADEKKFYADKMTDLAKSMSAADINDMEKSDWENPTWRRFAVPEFDKRLTNKDGKPSGFADQIERNVSQSMQEAMAAARGAEQGGGARPAAGEVLAQEEIDRRRQQRTEELRTQHGDSFETSAEYLANPSKYYSRQQYQQNARQQQRVMERLASGKAGAAEITSLNGFSRGQSDMLAVSDAMLAQAGVKPTAAGYTRDKKSVARIAGVFNQQLATDVQAIETQLAELATEEKGMQTPNSKLLDASGKPMTAAQANPEKLQDLQTRRTALEARKATIQNAQKRLQDPKSLESLQFINTDRAGVDVRSALAEERMHKNLDQLDPDRSMREELRKQFSTEEFAEIVQDMRVRAGDEKMSEQRAFDEYLTKGMVNRGRWGDKSADAVKLKAGTALALKAAQEKKQASGARAINLNVDDLEEVPEIVVPQKAGPGRYVKERVREGLDALKRPVSTRLEQRAQEEWAQVERAAQQRAAQAAQKQETTRQALLQAQQQQQQEEAKLATLKKQNSAKASDYQKSYDQNKAVYEDKTKSRAERDRANDIMGAYANSIESLKKDVDSQENVVEQARQKTIAQRATLGGTVSQPRAATDQDVMQPTSKSSRMSEAGRKLNRIVEPRGAELDKLDEEIRTHLPKNFKAFSEDEKKSLLEKPMQERLDYYKKVATGAAQLRQPMSTRATPNTSRSASTQTAPVLDVEEARAGSITNVTNVTNVTQNITNAFKAAPPDIRGKLMGIDSKTLDSALHNSIVWRGLMSYIKNNTAEIQKSEKLGDLGREELQKRIGKLQGHMDEGNAEAFKNEFGELQSMFSDGSSAGGSET